MALLNPALNSGRYILSVAPAVGPTSILRLPCGVNSALANATFAGNKAGVSGGAVYAVSTPVVGVLHQCCFVLSACCNCEGFWVCIQRRCSRLTCGKHTKLVAYF